MFIILPDDRISVQPFGTDCVEILCRLFQPVFFISFYKRCFIAELFCYGFCQRVASLVTPVESEVCPQHILGRLFISNELHEHRLTVTQVGKDLPQNFVLAYKPCQHSAQSGEITRQHVVNHPLPEGAILYVRHGSAHEVVDFGVSTGTHVKSVAPAAVHVAYAAVPVFVNAVKPDGNGILYIEQKRKDFIIVEAPRFLPYNTVQPDVQLIEESHVAFHVHGRMVKAFPSGCELVYREHDI